MIVLLLTVALVLLLVAGLLWAGSGQTVYATQGSGIIEAIPDALEAEPVPPSGHLVILSCSLAYGLGPPPRLQTAPTASAVCDRLDRLIETIVASGADIALLQEVDFSSQRTYDIDQLYYVAAALGWGYAARAVTWECRYRPWPWPHPVGRVRAGMGVISRYPLIQNVRHHLCKARPYPVLASRFWPRPTVQMVDVQCSGTSIRLFHAVLSTSRLLPRQQQLQALVTFVRDAYTPTSVLTGPLYPAGSGGATALSWLTTELGSRFQAVNTRHSTAPDGTEQARLHPVFVGTDLRPLDLQWLAMTAPIAEHAPLALHLRWALALTLS
jgi:endonuclease/exonuclease/phosphatase family metal-dependent hydrolase